MQGWEYLRHRIFQLDYSLERSRVDSFFKVLISEEEASLVGLVEEGKRVDFGVLFVCVFVEFVAGADELFDDELFDVVGFVLLSYFAGIDEVEVAHHRVYLLSGYDLFHRLSFGVFANLLIFINLIVFQTLIIIMRLLFLLIVTSQFFICLHT